MSIYIIQEKMLLIHFVVWHRSYTVVRKKGKKKKLTKLKTETNYVSCVLSLFEGPYTLSIINFNYTAKYLSELLLMLL